MNRSVRRARHCMLAFAVLAALVASGCGRKHQPETAAPPDTLSVPPPPDTAKKPPDTSATVVKSDSLSPEWVLIGNRQDELQAAIQNHQTGDVHQIVTGTCDIVAALADSTAQASPAKGPRLRRMVTQIRASAGRLDDLARTNNAGGMQAEFRKLDTLLIALKRLTGG